MRLVSTRGVPDEPARRYGFRGACRFTHEGRTETVEVQAAGNWDESSRQATEVLEPVVGWGSVRSVFRCREDPWLHRVVAPEDGGATSAGGGEALSNGEGTSEAASVACDLLEHLNTTGMQGLGGRRMGEATSRRGPVTARAVARSRPEEAASTPRRSPSGSPLKSEPGRTARASTAPSEPVSARSGAEGQPESIRVTIEARSDSGPAEASRPSSPATGLLERVATAPRSNPEWSAAVSKGVGRVAALLAGGRTDEAMNAWRDLVRAGGGAAATATDVDALAARTLRAAYVEPEEELRNQADRLRYYREQEEVARALISKLQRERTDDAESRASLRRMQARVVEVRGEATAATAELRAALDRRPDVRDRLEEGWRALRGAVRR